MDPLSSDGGETRSRDFLSFGECTSQWPPIFNAVRATVFLWGEDRLGVSYEFADGRRQAQAVGDDDLLVNEAPSAIWCADQP